MDRISLNGLIANAVQDIVDLAWQIDCMLEMGNHLSENLRLTEGENRQFLHAIRENGWALVRMIRGGEVVEDVRPTFETLVAGIVATKLGDVFDDKLNEAFDDMDWAKYNVVTQDELSDYATEGYVDDKVDDLPCEDKVRTIIDDVVESLEVTSVSTRVRRGY